MVDKMLDTVITAIWVTIWMAGIVMATGFWSTFFAIFSAGLWSFYLVLETVMIRLGLL